MSFYLIGLSGKKQTGKDTVCKIIQELVPSSLRIAFADALKEEVSKATGYSLDFIEEHKKHFRLILQGWGSDFRRDLCDKEYWIKKFLEKLNKVDETVLIVIVPDVRFRNEYTLIKNLGGYVWRVERLNREADCHCSETELDGEIFDRIITNDGSIDQLKFDVKDLIYSILRT